MRRWKASLALLLGILLGPSSTIGDSQDPVSELRQLSEAIKEARTQVRFEADLTSYAFSAKETRVTRFRIRYAYPYRKRESIEESGKSRFVALEDGHYLWTYFPARKLVVKEPLRREYSPFPLSPNEDLNLLMQNYELVIRGPVPASDGMQCRIVEFIPRSGDRPYREFWLEQRWNVPVRVRVSSHDGRPAYMAELSNLRWDPALDEQAFVLKVPQDTRVYEVREKANLTKEDAERILNRTVVLPRSIPPGYRTQNIVLRRQGPRQSLQVIYSDGLSSFSLFQEWSDPGQAGPPGALQLPVRAAAPVSSSRQFGLVNVVTLPGAGRRAVIVGDIRKDMMIRIAESLRESIRESLGDSLIEALPEAVPQP